MITIKDAIERFVSGVSRFYKYLLREQIINRSASELIPGIPQKLSSCVTSMIPGTLPDAVLSARLQHSTAACGSLARFLLAVL